MFEMKINECPICGEPPMFQTAKRANNGELWQLAGVWCKPCGIDAYSSSDEEATRKWNDRAGRKPEAVPAAEAIAGSLQRPGYAAPVNILKAIIEEARNRHDDILTEESWNPNYTLEISLKVKELRELAGWLKQHNDQAQ